jgi:hypothetical protein
MEGINDGIKSAVSNLYWIVGLKDRGAKLETKLRENKAFLEAAVL